MVFQSSSHRFSLRLCLCILAVAALAHSANAASGSLILEENFNDKTGVELKNGAALGPAGSGVSGLPADRCYVSHAPEAGATAGSLANITATPKLLPENLDELTITAWYQSSADQHDDAILYNAFGTLLIWDQQKGQWTLRVDAAPVDGDKHMYWFMSGGKPPQHSWMPGGEWTFIGIVWKRNEKKVEFFQGGPNAEVTSAREMVRGEEVQPLTEHANARRTIGNDGTKTERYFDGSIDDVRFYAKALDKSDLEKIRAADLKNKPAPIQ